MAKENEVVSVTMSQLKDLISALAPGRKLSGADFHAKVQRIKNHEGEFEKPPRVLVPPPGFAIVSDKIGQSPKVKELSFVLHQGARVKPFLKGRGERKAPANTGQNYGAVIDGSLRILAFTPYPDGVVVGKGGAPIDQALLFPNFGDQDAPIPITSQMVKQGNTWFDNGYLEGTVKPASKKAS